MSLTSLTTTVVPGLSEAGAHESSFTPYIIGIGTFVLLMAMMLALVMFGAGRDHS